MRLTLPEIKRKISKLIPDDIDSDVTLEAGSIAIITKQPGRFSGGSESLTVRIAKNIKRRVVVRPHPDILADEAEVYDAVNRIIPPEAMVRNTWLDPALSEVILECDDPSSAVGPKGSHINALRDEIGWLVKVERAPARQSRTHHDSRR